MNAIRDFRFECEVRYCIKLGLTGKLDGYLDEVCKKRGIPEARKLRDAARNQYRLGNRGDYGDWRK